MKNLTKKQIPYFIAYCAICSVLTNIFIKKFFNITGVYYYLLFFLLGYTISFGIFYIIVKIINKKK